MVDESELIVRINCYHEIEDIPYFNFETNEDEKQDKTTKDGITYYYTENYDALRVTWKDGKFPERKFVENWTKDLTCEIIYIEKLDHLYLENYILGHVGSSSHFYFERTDQHDKYKHYPKLSVR